MLALKSQPEGVIRGSTSYSVESAQAYVSKPTLVLRAMRA
jgi:hypothetical protein